MACSVSVTWLPDTPHARPHWSVGPVSLPQTLFPFMGRDETDVSGQTFFRLRDVVRSVFSRLVALYQQSNSDAGGGALISHRFRWSICQHRTNSCPAPCPVDQGFPTADMVPPLPDHLGKQSRAPFSMP